MSDSLSVARIVVQGLYAAGVRHFVYCPGSRNSPFAYVLHQFEQEHGDVVTHVRTDERGAGFYAIGLSRGAEFAPVAVFMTSGTAVAELHPAVVEAAHSCVPLLVVSADRPYIMHGVGASQTIEQLGIFGPSIPLWNVPVGAVADVRLCSAVQRQVARARGIVDVGGGVAAGPVHINVEFDAPLVPQTLDRDETFNAVDCAQVSYMRAPSTGLDWHLVVDSRLRTVIVIGDGAAESLLRIPVEDLAQRYPIFAEPTAAAPWREYFPAYRVMLNSAYVEQIEQVVVFGRPTLNRELTALLSRSDVRQVVVTGRAPVTDTAGAATSVVDFLAAPGSEEAEPEQQRFLEWSEEVHALALQAVCAAIDEYGVGEPEALAQLVASAPIVVLGASNAVRLADSFGWFAHSPAVVVSNRGAAGIDGTIATARGIAESSGRQVTLVVGDLTFLHDLNSLADAPGAESAKVRILLLDNGGGGIFATLEPGREQLAAAFDRWFATAQRVDFAALAQGFDCDYRGVESTQQLSAALSWWESPQTHGVRILHAQISHDVAVLNALKRSKISVPEL